MKYALFILAFFVLTTIENAQARTVHSFRESDAITSIAQFLYDMSGDMPVSYRISDKKIKISNNSNCIQVKASDALSDFESTVTKVIRFYPDEEIPFEQALLDMEDYLDGKNYLKCQIIKKEHDVVTTTSYYYDHADKIHLRIDHVAPLSE